MTAQRRAFRIFDYTSLAAILLFMAWQAWAWWGPSTVGRFFPVMSPAELTFLRPDPPPEWRNVWAVKSSKLRPCNYVGIEWFAGPRGGRVVQVRAEFISPPRIIGVGAHEWDGLVVHLEPGSVLENSFADVLHECRLGPISYRVRTQWWTGLPPEMREARG